MARASIGTEKGKKVTYELNTLTRHAAVLGTTGSGKTVLCKVLIEECLIRAIPVIAIDPKGDIGSLGVVDERYDFRPFPGAAKLANQYQEKATHTREELRKLAKSPTSIYTPNAKAGIDVALLPDLSTPPRFNPDDHDAATFVETVSGSLLDLAGVKGAQREKAQSFIAQLLIESWKRKEDLNLESLVARIREPPFDTIGSLPLDEFMKEAERKRLAASINVLLTSPAKRAWAKGEPLDAKRLLSNGLSVFDIRELSQEERRFVVEQVLQELYRTLLRKGGSERLKAVLYIDELAGLLPPPPSSPPVKKLLELLIRQARAFGLGIIVATQNPGDIDYKLLGNLGTRFIGRLRTENDIEKVASAMDLAPSRLKHDVAALSTGEFVYHNAVKNTRRIIAARWLASYHRGPLSAKEVGWVNEPSSRPKREGPLKPRSPKTAKKASGKAPKRPQKQMSADDLVRSVPSKPAKKLRAKPGAKRDEELEKLIRVVKRHADTLTIRRVPGAAERLVPHLRLVVEPAPLKGVDLAMQGPWYFDLTARMIPEGNYLQGLTWSQYVPKGIAIHPPRRSIVQAFDYALKEAKRELRTLYFESTITSARSRERSDVEAANDAHLTKVVAHEKKRLAEREEKEVDRLRAAIERAERAQAGLRRKLLMKTTGRALKRLVRGKQREPAQARRWRSRLEDRKREVQRLRKEIRRVRAKRRRAKLEDDAAKRAEQAVKVRRHRPTREALIVHATLILVPPRQ